MFEEEQTKYQIVKEYFDDKINKTKVFFRSIKIGISNFLYYGKTISLRIVTGKQIGRAHV